MGLLVITGFARRWWEHANKIVVAMVRMCHTGMESEGVRDVLLLENRFYGFRNIFPEATRLEEWSLNWVYSNS